MVAASEYQHTQYSGTLMRPGTAREIDNHAHNEPHERPVEVILDFEYRDWNFKVQPGALRRIIMNIFGNAQKYTSSGFILVQLRIKDDEDDERFVKRKVLSINIVDSGRGMSTEFMERKLYTPFAQEDTFATGVGLGLSIVWSIVHQLDGKIQIRSEVGKGTDVEVIIPLDEGGQRGHAHQNVAHNETAEGREADQNIEQIRSLSAGKTVAIWRYTHHKNHDKRNKSLAWDCLEKYCSEWFGFRVSSSSSDFNAMTNADLVIMEQQDKDFSGLMIPFSSKKANLLLIRDELSWHDERKTNRHRKEFGNIWTPIGPHKLAKVVLSLFRQDQAETKPRFCLIHPHSRTQSSGATTMPITPSKVGKPAEGALIARAHAIALTKSETDPTTDRTYLEPSIAEESSLANIADLTLTAEPYDRPCLITSTSTPAASPWLRKVSLRTSTPSPPQSTTPLRLLAVDDNDLNLQLLSRYLKKRKCDIVTTASDGLEALQAVKKLHDESSGRDKFDIVFMDISMPVMDGFESTSAIRDFERECASKWQEGPWGGRSCIVALTGLGSRRDRDKAVEAGVDEFMTKPVSFKNVGALIERICRAKEGERVERIYLD